MKKIFSFSDAIANASRFFCIVAFMTCFHVNSWAQGNRIPGPIDNGQRFTIPGSLPPLLQLANDQGSADASLKLDRITLVLKPSDTQTTELKRLLADLHDPNSSGYHNWLTPESFARRFGLSETDIAKIVGWLNAQQLTVTSVARARNAITVSGTVASVASAFQTEIHTYFIGNETHYANATAPSLPSALQGIVQAIHGLNDFRLQPRHVLQTSLAWRRGATPKYTSPSNGNHYLAPDDFATIFDIKPLYNVGIDGSNQSIVIVGQSRIDESHLITFRSSFGLGDARLLTTLVPNSRDPGTRQTDEQESDLDLEWASAVARAASLRFVYSYDVLDAVQYAIDQNYAPVLSMSYGECETSSSESDALSMQAWAQQANAQGITWVAASGDSGAAGCYISSLGPLGSGNADISLSADLPASIPEVTGIGGTRFDEGSGSYWNTANDPSSSGSAQSYIPETSWNDSTTNDLAASGGGVSQFFTKPSWQTGVGVPSDGARDVPDLAFPGSADHDGYIVYTSSGPNTGWYVIGGTSAGAPAFSGILSLLNQYLIINGYQSNAGLGNINTRAYELAASSPAAFHDITTGDNIVTATVCSGLLCSSPKTKSVGYSAGTGYDLVTGLGSLDVYTFFAAWQN